MRAYPVEINILDDENEHRLIAVVKGFDEESIELSIKDFLISDSEEIDKLAESIKQCLKMYQAGILDE